MNQEFLNQLPLKDIQCVQAVGGGDVNDAYKVDTASDSFFLLVQRHVGKDFYMAEASGLRDFARAGVTAPQVIALGEIGSDAYLLLTYLDEGCQRDYPALAQMVAKMHRYTSESGLFGYDYPLRGAKMTYDNAWTDSWTELFVEWRLDPLRDELVRLGYWDDREVDQFTQAREIMVGILDRQNSQPALLHGDLWGGNHLFLKDGTPALFDPSPMFGDREFDLGVATSFGVYPREFFTAYHRAYPLAFGWEERLAYYRLYVYMNHLHKFGHSYTSRVNQTLQEILEQ